MSERVTLVAGLGPKFVTLIVNETSVSGRAADSFVVFVTPRSATFSGMVVTAAELLFSSFGSDGSLMVAMFVNVVPGPASGSRRTVSMKVWS